MAVFVHLTAEDNMASIRKNGIKSGDIHFEEANRGIFCMPVINDFFATHQWLREIKRFNKKNIIGVYFKIPDDELVWYGFYNEEPKQCKASIALNQFMHLENRLGFEVILPRKLMAKEIVRIKYLPQSLGWRYYPTAHEKKLCLCPACLGKGVYKSVQIREQKYYELVSKLRETIDETEKTQILTEIDDIIQFSSGKIKDYKVLLPFLEIDSTKNIIRVISALSNFSNEEVIKTIIRFLEYPDFDVKNTCADAIFKIKGEKGFDILKEYKEDEDLKRLLEEYKDVYEL